MIINLEDGRGIINIDVDTDKLKTLSIGVIASVAWQSSGGNGGLHSPSGLPRCARNDGFILRQFSLSVGDGTAMDRL